MINLRSFLLTLSLCKVAAVSQLVVNVKNKGGDVVVENIRSNTTSDTVVLEYQNTDGSLVTQMIDFKSVKCFNQITSDTLEVQIIRVYIPGEEERGQSSQYQVVCFVTRFSKSDFIAADPMSKLRQKNPTAVRTPEEDKGLEVHDLDMIVNLSKASVISPFIFNICQEAKSSTYTHDTGLKTISRSLGKDYKTLFLATEKVVLSNFSNCRENSDLGKPCICQYSLCIKWYPCGLKYCRGKDSTGNVVSYRCGIKTCQKCHSFNHLVKQKALCLWDVL